MAPSRWMMLTLAMMLAGCEWLNESNPVTQTVRIPPCCNDGTSEGTATSPVTNCSCEPIIRGSGASSCALSWVGGLSVYDWTARRTSDGLTDAGTIQRGGEVDPGPPGQGAGLWVITLGDGLCQAGFDADS